MFHPTISKITGELQILVSSLQYLCQWTKIRTKVVPWHPIMIPVTLNEKKMQLWVYQTAL